MLKYILVFLCTISLYSFQVAPMNMELNSKNKYQGFFHLHNQADTEEIVTIYTSDRMIDSAGEESTKKCNDFTIYPSHVTLKPKEQRIVRILWKKKKEIPYELPYRITFEQKMVNIPKDAESIGEEESCASISIAVKYVCALYVGDANAKGDIKVKDFSIIKEDGKDFLLCNLENVGNKHAYLRKNTMEIGLKLDNTEDIFYIPENYIEEIASDINILARGARLLKLPIDKDIPRNITAVAIAD